MATRLHGAAATRLHVAAAPRPRRVWRPACVPEVEIASWRSLGDLAVRLRTRPRRGVAATRLRGILLDTKKIQTRGLSPSRVGHAPPQHVAASPRREPKVDGAARRAVHGRDERVVAEPRPLRRVEAVLASAAVAVALAARSRGRRALLRGRARPLVAWAVTKSQGAIKVPRGTGVFLNVSEKFWRISRFT